MLQEECFVHLNLTSKHLDFFEQIQVWAMKLSLPCSCVELGLLPAPCRTETAERGNVLVYYLIAANYPLVPLLSWTAAVLCFMPSATSSLTAKIQIISMKRVLVAFKWTIRISDLKKETCSCDTSCFQSTTPQRNQAIRQGYMCH